MLLDISNTGQMPSSGTNFKAAMDRALESFEALDNQGGSAANVLLFVADGEIHDTDYRTSHLDVVNNIVTILAVGFGRMEGGSITHYHIIISSAGLLRD